MLTRRFSFGIAEGATRAGGEVRGGREDVPGGMALLLSEEGVVAGLEGDIGRVEAGVVPVEREL